jgi:hypothetical protein
MRLEKLININTNVEHPACRYQGWSIRIRTRSLILDLGSPAAVEEIRHLTRSIMIWSSEEHCFAETPSISWFLGASSPYDLRTLS